uniref:Uncharacterized protein n=1 Tax=Calidris pygmaea TaxID=425635 RepID=A0A8C3JBT6_9CHAR
MGFFGVWSFLLLLLLFFGCGFFFLHYRANVLEGVEWPYHFQRRIDLCQLRAGLVVMSLKSKDLNFFFTMQLTRACLRKIIKKKKKCGQRKS